jgi:HSP20 family protein
MALLIRRPGRFMQESPSFEDFMRFPRTWDEEVLPYQAGVNLYETSGEVVLEMAVPGLRPEEISLQLEENILTITGKHNDDEEDGEKDKRHYHQQQLHYARFSQVITLPSSVEGDKAEASFNNGILKVSLPKIEAAKPKQIHIKTN